MNQTQSASVLALPWKLVKTIQTTTYVWVSSWPAFTVDEGLSWFNLIHSKGKPTWNSHIGSGASFDSSWWAHFSCQGWNLCGLSLAFFTDWRVVGDKPLKPFDLTHYKWDRTMKKTFYSPAMPWASHSSWLEILRPNLSALLCLVFFTSVRGESLLSLRLRTKVVTLRLCLFSKSNRLSLMKRSLTGIGMGDVLSDFQFFACSFLF